MLQCGQHGGVMVSTVASQQEIWIHRLAGEFLCGVCMFSACLRRCFLQALWLPPTFQRCVCWVNWWFYMSPNWKVWMWEWICLHKLAGTDSSPTVKKNIYKINSKKEKCVLRKTLLNIKRQKSWILLSTFHNIIKRCSDQEFRAILNGLKLESSNNSHSKTDSRTLEHTHKAHFQYRQLFGYTHK